MKVDLQAVAARVDLRNFCFPISLRVERDDRWLGSWRIVVTAKVPDRDTGALTLVNFVESLPGFFVDSMERQPERLLYEAVKKCVLHEVAESFHLDGRRIYDPHANDPKPKTKEERP